MSQKKEANRSSKKSPKKLNKNTKEASNALKENLLVSFLMDR